MTQPSVSALATASLEEVRQHLLTLFATLAYQEGNFTLSSGQSSTYYINGKKVTLTAEGALAVGRLLFSLLESDTVAVAGLTLGADPLVTAVSVVSAYENQPVAALIIRKE
ncbi:MAG: orotate phosphoribosyltransferase, partial [Microcystaceae cyanobacterium]